MNVQTPLRRKVQHPLRQDKAIRSHHHGIGIRLQQGFACSRSIFGILAIQSQAQRLNHANPMLQRTLFDGRGLQLHATASRAIRLCQHQWHFKPGLQQTFQGHTRKLGRARKNDFHEVYPAVKGCPGLTPGQQAIQWLRSSGSLRSSSVNMMRCTTPCGSMKTCA